MAPRSTFGLGEVFYFTGRGEPPAELLAYAQMTALEYEKASWGEN